MNIPDYVKNAFLHLWQAITGRSAQLWEFLAPIVASEAGSLLQDLEPLAIAAVTAAATSTGDKRQAAFDAIQSEATAAGIHAGESIINTSIELAVQNLKAKGTIQ